MSVLEILFGACIASMVWAMVLMRYIERDLKDDAEMQKLLHDYFNGQKELGEAQSNLIESIKNSAEMIREHNMEFKLEVLNLLEKWGCS